MDEWVILGSGTLEQQPDRGPSCHLLRGPGGDVLVDSGPGCLQRLAERGVDTAQLRAVVHSHLHLDHLADLLPLLFARSCSTGLPSLLLSGAPGHEDRLRAVRQALYPKLLSSPLRFQEIAPGQGAGLLPGLRLSAFPADHRQSPRILRFEGPGWSLAYTGDSGPCPGIVEAARGVDWLVAECTTPDDRRRARHLTPRDVAEVVRQARPRAVALVHLSPLWRRPEDAAEAVARHLGEPSGLTIVGARDGTSLGLPSGYSHSIVPGGLLEMS